MTTRAERTTEIPADIEAVWAFIADPSARARAISVVDSFELLDDEGSRARWHIRLPIPFVSSTVAVETRELERTPPTYVKFEGSSPVLHVVGEHELTDLDGATRLRTRFTVDGRLPGVETFFRRNLDPELDNLERALLAEVAP